MNHEFKQGIKDGIPIAIGYFSVSFSFGILAVKDGLSLFQAVLISLTNVTSAGQFAGQSQGQGNFYAQNNRPSSNNNVANFGAPPQINQPSANNNVTNFGVPPQINQPVQQGQIMGQQPVQQNAIPQGQPMQQNTMPQGQPIQQNAIPQGQPVQQNVMPQGQMAQQPIQQGGYNPSAVGNSFPPSGDSVF